MPFNGRATHDTGIFDGMAEDVSDIISMISPYETPLLDRLGTSNQPATNVLHEWLEDSLNPNTIVSSTTLDSLNEVSMGVHIGGNAVTQYLQVGAILRSKKTSEYLQITAISGNTITVSRGFGGSTVNTVAAGAELFLVSDAALEGSDVSGDISRPRSRKSNYTQIFKKDLMISGTQQAVTQIGVTDELEYQKLQRTRESIRDLEKAVIQGKISGNSLGSDTAYRTFKGLWDFISTNATSTGTLTPTILDNIIQTAWASGGTDATLIIADANWKRLIDSFNTSRIQIPNESGERFVNRVTYFESTFGNFEVMLGRWMMDNTLMIISPERVKVVPLAGRSYRYVPIAPTGDASKGMVIGEYTLEVRNEEGLAKAYG